MDTDHPSDVRADAVDRWAASGAMALTGFAHRRPLGPPAGLVPRLDRLARRFPNLDPLALLVERAAWAGMGRHGTTSCGGACRLLRATDGWLAVSLPRPDDVELVPAWLADPAAGEEPARIFDSGATWDEVGRGVRSRNIIKLEDRAELLGLAVAGLGTARTREPVVRTAFDNRRGPGPERSGRRPAEGLTVVDLSALWAGPLCGELLRRCGATVIKVESTARPDGARRGVPEFFDRLNGGKASVALDLDDPTGVRSLRHLIERADVVIESSRPRALRQLGIDPAAVLSDATARPRVWVSITGHGRGDHDPGDHGCCRIGFGDDTAVAGGLVGYDGPTPVFCGDAIADPCTGLTAAGACLDALDEGGRWLLDIALAAVAASLAGPTLAVPAGTLPASPVRPTASPPAPRFGSDTARVLRDMAAPR